MIGFIGHPRTRQLNRFADGELGQREHARVAAHLTGCARCREHVAFTRRIGDAARSLGSPPVRPELLDRVLGRRRAGERILLPVSDPGVARRRPRVALPAVIAAMLTLLVAGLLVRTTVLSADESRLRIAPERPQAGELLSIAYDDAGRFPDDTHLMLRTRYRTASDREWQQLGGILIRDDDGLFHTSLELPDSVVYAAFAVEDLHSRQLDSNNRELWDVVIHDRDGRPLLDGMWARALDLEPWDWGEAYETTIRVTQLYPDSPQSWMARYSFEESIWDPDTLKALHLERFEQMERAMANAASPSSNQMAWLGIYGLHLGEIANGDMWLRIAGVDLPRHRAVVEGQVYLATRRNPDAPQAVLEELENLWSGPKSPGSKRISAMAVTLSLQGDFFGVLESWLPRYVAAHPGESIASLGRNVSPVEARLIAPFLAAEAERQKRMNLADRPLRLTRSESSRRHTHRQQQTLAELARAKAISSDESGLEVASSALAISWNSGALRTIGGILLAGGDREGALTAFARAAADPEAGRLVAADLDSLGNPFSRASWQSALTDAKGALSSAIMDAAVVRYLDPSIILRRGGDQVRWEEVEQPRLTVIAFWASICGPALSELPRLQALSERLAREGVSTVLIDIGGDPSRAEGGALRVYEDSRGMARAEFRSSKTPDYYILDSQGRIRFEHTTLAEIPRQVEALRRAEATSVAALTAH